MKMALKGLKAALFDWWIEGLVLFFVMLCVSKVGFLPTSLLPIVVVISISSGWDVLGFLIGVTILGFLAEKVQMFGVEGKTVERVKEGL